jgi:hypothetical protein
VDLIGEELGCGIAPAKFGEFIEIAIVEFREHRLQQVKSAPGIPNDPIRHRARAAAIRRNSALTMKVALCSC